MNDVSKHNTDAHKFNIGEKVYYCYNGNKTEVTIISIVDNEYVIRFEPVPCKLFINVVKEEYLMKIGDK